MYCKKSYFFFSSILLFLHTALYIASLLENDFLCLVLIGMVAIACIFSFGNTFLSETMFQSITFISLYVFPVPVMVLMGVEVPLLKNTIYHSLLNDYLLNVKMLMLYSLACLGINISCFFAKLIFGGAASNIGKIKGYGSALNIWLFLAVILLMFSLTQLNWDVLIKEYNVGRGFTFVFGSLYIINFLFLVYFSTKHIENRISFFWCLLVFVIFSLLMYLGIRQILIWGIASYILLNAHLYHLGLKNKKIKLSRVYLCAFVVLVVGGILTSYRVERELSQGYEIFRLAWKGYLWEAAYTYLGGLNAIYQVDQGNYSPFANIVNYFALLVPSFFGSFREEYFLLSNFLNDYSIATQGTVIVLGEVYISTGNLLRYFIFFFVFYFIIESIIVLLKKKNYFLYSPLITFLQVMVCFYAVRGGLYSGLKIFTVFALFTFIALRLSSKISLHKSRVAI